MHHPSSRSAQRQTRHFLRRYATTQIMCCLTFCLRRKSRCTPCDLECIVIVISKLLKRYSKAKRTRAPAYSRALRRIKGGLERGGEEKLRSEFQSTRRGQSSC